ncbi:TraR/DksA C4-type zinc finger protein [Hoeflea sp.]|uniref:TraR/DksA C4-type zinc finger protein n=1 Tax=Hoeflea sp. TaxID=1940281 RepID=UPI003A95B429
MIEQAEERVARERDLKLEHAAKLVAEHGQSDCKDCGFEIPPDRRAAAPFAKRCFECQQAYELDK